MKSTLLLLAATCIGSQAFAQTQSAFVDAEALLGAEAADTKVNVKAGTVVAKSDNVTMTTAFEDDYKIVALYAEADSCNQLVIDGKSYACTKGIQGQTNPENNNLAKASTSGAVFRFDVTANGYLYVVSKLSNNKNYYVWEGETTNSNSLNKFVNILAYNLTAFGTDGVKSTYTLPADEDGYFVSHDDNSKISYADGAQAYLSTSWKRDYLYLPDAPKDKITWADYEADKDGIKATVDAYLTENRITICAKDAEGADKYLCKSIVNNGETMATASDCAVAAGSNKINTGNALGVIAFPVLADFTYFVNATGSKITCDGFVFIPGATELATIEGKKGDASAIKNITMDDLDTDAPVYNLQGQRVSKSYKGVCIQNGKKFIVK